MGPLHAGLYGGSDVYGLRGGQWGNKKKSGGFGAIVFPDLDIEATVWSLEDFSFGEVRQKDFESRGYPLLAFAGWREHRTRYFYTQIEAAVGLLGGVRLGVNPGELLDFVVGFAGMDVFGDDRGQQRCQDELVFAIQYGAVAQVKRLIAAGADVNFRSDQGYFPLYSTIPYRHNYPQNMEMARLLIAAGADVNAATCDGNTMLHLIIDMTYERQQALELASFLIASGAQVNVRNDRGRTPLDEARSKRWTEMEKLLLENGAE